MGGIDQTKESVLYLHHAKRLHCGGGMETVMRSHLRESGENSHFVSFLRGDKKDSDRQHCLDGSPNLSLSGLRRLYKTNILNRLSARASLYHNCWGLDLFADLDPAQLRIGFFHSSYPKLEKFVRYYGQFADGFVFVNEAMMDRSRRILPHWDESRFAYFPHILKIPASIENQRYQPRDDVRIGYAGRLIKKQKRIDRIPAFLEQLDRHLPDYTFEILGDGPDEGWLQQALAGRKNVLFHDWKKGSEYWETLQRWKFTVFFSDYEGLPIALMEALACGVIPLYPDYYDGRDLLGQIDTSLLYRQGGMEDLVKSLCSANQWSIERTKQFFEKSQSILATNTEDSLEIRYDRFLTGLDESLPSAQRYRQPISLMRSLTPLWRHNRRVNWDQ